MLTVLLLLALQAVPATTPTTRGDQPEYIIGANDLLVIAVFNQPQLSGRFVVEADGTITFPLLGRVPVAGLSIRGVEDAMRTRLAGGYVKDPHVSVTVEQFRSQQIFVMGEVRQPGSLQFTGSMTLLEALAKAGSTTDQAGDELLVVRPRTNAGSNGNPAAHADTETLRVDLHGLQAGTLSHNLPLRPGDTILVPRAEPVFVLGHVRAPGEYVIRTGMTVRQVLALAGGMTERASTRRIQIIRKAEDGSEVTVGARLQDLIRAGETVVVRERLF